MEDPPSDPEAVASTSQLGGGLRPRTLRLRREAPEATRKLSSEETEEDGSRSSFGSSPRPALLPSLLHPAAVLSSLKRSNSAPSIHRLGLGGAPGARVPSPLPASPLGLQPPSPSPSSSLRHLNFIPASLSETGASAGGSPRTEGPPSRASSPADSVGSSFSASSFRDSRDSSRLEAPSRSRHPSAQTVRSPPPIPSRRVQYIRRESLQSAAKADSDSERLVRGSEALSSGMEDFALDEAEAIRKGANRLRAVSLTEPISVMTSFAGGPVPASSSPSPTRPAAVDSQKQCFSPSTQQLVRHNIAFSPSPRSTPSPNRKQMLRSLSPIAVLNRPFPLGLKRRAGGDDWASSSAGDCSSPKRVASWTLGSGGSASNSAASTPLASPKALEPSASGPFRLSLPHSLPDFSRRSASTDPTPSALLLPPALRPLPQLPATTLPSSPNPPPPPLPDLAPATLQPMDTDEQPV